MTLPWSLAPISPVQNGTIAATATSQSIALGGAPLAGMPVVADANTVIISNTGTNEAFVEFGGSGVEAVAGGGSTAAADGSACVPAGAILSFSAYLPAATHVAGICAAGLTTTLRITRGKGS